MVGTRARGGRGDGHWGDCVAALQDEKSVCIDGVYLPCYMLPWNSTLQNRQDGKSYVFHAHNAGETTFVPAALTIPSTSQQPRCAVALRAAGGTWPCSPTPHDSSLTGTDLERQRLRGVKWCFRKRGRGGGGRERWVTWTHRDAREDSARASLAAEMLCWLSP